MLGSELAGKAAESAAQLESYCAHALVQLRAGEPGGSPWSRLFGRSRRRGTKDCPECAETVKSAALSCRFCGHRFDG